MLLFSTLRRNKVLIFLSFLLLWLIAGLRDSSVGTDTFNYEFAFNSFSRGVDRNVEPFWKYLNLLVIKVFGSFQIFLLTAQVLILIPIYYVAKKLQLNMFLMLFFYISLYIFAYSLNITRQCVAISMSLLCLYNVSINQNKKAFGWSVVSILFHYSAAVTLLYLIVNKIPTKLPIQLIAMFATILIGVVIPGELFGYILSYAYEDYARVSDNVGAFEGNLYFLIILNSFYLFIYWVDGEKGTFFKAFFLFVLISNMLIRIPFGMRVITYFSVVQIIYFPHLIHNNRLSSKEVVFFVLVAYALAIYWMNFGFGGIFPYTFYFDR